MIINDAVSTGDSAACIARLQERVGALGRRFFRPESQIGFPIKFICKSLEDLVIQRLWVDRSFDYAWCARGVLDNAGVPWVTRYDTYHTLLEDAKYVTAVCVWC